ncbi:MAG TPA: hypothetical protein VFR87_15935 [Nocardioidaceae bacterium]|nr:hypothetical protein [Nocardioidaceae bacterium]
MGLVLASVALLTLLAVGTLLEAHHPYRVGRPERVLAALVAVTAVWVLLEAIPYGRDFIR